MLLKLKLLYVIISLTPGACVVWLCSIPIWLTSGSTYNPASELSPPFIGYKTIPGPATWYKPLPDCPCQIPLQDQAGAWPPKPSNLDAQWSWPPSNLTEGAINFHPGATWEIRWGYTNQSFDEGKVPDMGNTWQLLWRAPSQNPQVIATGKMKTAAGQQCNYDQKGQLITGSIAAGTADRWSFRDRDNAVDKIGHTAFDVVPYLAGYLLYRLGDTNNADLNWSLQNWPTNRGNACPACTKIENGLCAIKQPPALPPPSGSPSLMFVAVLLVTIGLFLLVFVALPLLLLRLIIRTIVGAILRVFRIFIPV
jgi:hypothetical protein